jgi:RNA polymerase sigma-70 factor (ECF subfamily)
LPAGNSDQDIKLVRLALRGDDKAFEQLLACHRQRIIGICLRMLGDRLEAEEAAQDCFVKIYFHLRDFDQARDFTAWAASIALNECRDRLRRRTRRTRIFKELTEMDAVSVPESLADNNDCREQLAETEKAIEELPSKLKEVLILKAFGEYGYEEIAKILGVKIGTVMSRLFRARQKLTGLLNRGKQV